MSPEKCDRPGKKVVAWGGVVVRTGWGVVNQWCEGEKVEAWVEVLVAEVVENEGWWMCWRGGWKLWGG